MRSLNPFRLASALVLSITLVPGPAVAQDGETLTMTGTFKMNALYPIVGDDLAAVFADGGDYWWRLTLSGVTYSHEHFFVVLENGGYVDRYFTRVHAASFRLEFFGPNAAILNDVVSPQLAGGAFPGNAVLELYNADIVDPDDPWSSGPQATWDLWLVPLGGEGISFTTYWWYDYPQFATDADGYPLVQPQRLWSQESLIWDQRAGNTGVLASYGDMVDLGSDQPPTLPPPQIDIGSASVPEGDRGTTTLRMTVTLSRAFEQAVTVNYETADGTATAGTDYTAASGTLTFQPGQTSTTIAPSIKGDRKREPTETFTVRLSNAVGATIGYAVGTATILNDD